MNQVSTELGESYLLSRFQVTCGLGDHFATTVAHLLPKCVLSVAFSFKYLCLYNNAAKIFGTEGVVCRRFVNIAIKRRLKQAEGVDYQRIPLGCFFISFFFVPKVVPKILFGIAYRNLLFYGFAFNKFVLLLKFI